MGAEPPVPDVRVSGLRAAARTVPTISDATRRACDACLRRTWLVARLAGRLEIARHQRRPLREVLALADAELLDGLAGDDAPRIAAQARAVRPTALREQVATAGLVALCRHDERYPERLREDRSAPVVLFVAARGGEALVRLEALASGPAVAVVGTRRASVEGLEVARTIGRGLAAAGVTVISGMALGIDSAAHAGAVEAGGRTIAVLAGGADVPYPVRKRALYEQIRLRGAAVAEMPPGFRAHRWCFPARNRTIAGLAAATIVIEAAERSGSLITAELALDLGREVGAVPGPVLSWRSAGTNALLRDGATVIRGARDALDLALGVDGADAFERARRSATAPPADLAPELAALLAAVDDGRDTVAALATGADGIALVRAGLTELELLGLVRRVPGGRWLRAIQGLE